MVLNVRPARARDAAEATSLLNAIVRRGGTTAIETELTAEQTLQWFLTGKNVHCAHVAFDDSVMVGWQSVGRNANLPDGWGDMATFAALGLTGRGTGAALFAASLARAKALGLSHLNANIRADNEGGLAYYARMGFQDYTVARAVPLLDGTPVDRIFKSLDLGQAVANAK